jgi:hypothetical protein
MSQFSVNVYPPPTISVDVAPPSALSIDVVAGPIVSGGGGGGGGATNLDGLTDVVITSPSTGQLLRFDGTNWVNATLDSVSTSGSYSNPAWITSLAWSKLTGVPSTFEPSAHVHSWSEITTGKPTTLSGYGISDAQPLDSDLTAIADLSTTAFGRSVLIQADGPAVRSLIGGQKAITSGTASPSGGADGDIYLQYT